MEIDHSRGLCGKPDIPTENIPREVVEKQPAHCRCCGQTMMIGELGSIGMQQLGMYYLYCTMCPKKTAQ